MKNIYLFLCLLVFAGACRGPEGPSGLPGPQGPKGQDGTDGFDGEEAYVFEYKFDFLEEFGYSEPLPFPDDFQALSSDVVLVYLFYGTDDDGFEIWRLLPQAQIINGFGWLQYNFDFTQNGAFVFMEAEFPLSQLGPDYTAEWWARVVVVPSQLWETGRVASPVDYSDYDAVKEAYGLPDLEIPEDYLFPERFTTE